MQQDAPPSNPGTDRGPLCREPWESYYILRRGILPCCHGHKAIAPMADWQTAWNSAAMQEIRRHLARGELSPYCRKSLACPIVQRVTAEQGGSAGSGKAAALGYHLRNLLRRILSRSGGSRPAPPPSAAVAELSGDQLGRPGPDGLKAANHDEADDEIDQPGPAHL